MVNRLPTALQGVAVLIQAAHNIFGRRRAARRIAKHRWRQGAGDGALLDDQTVADLARQRPQQIAHVAGPLGVLAQIGAGHLAAVVQGQHRALDTGIDQIGLQCAVILQIGFRSALLGPVEWRLGDIQITTLQ